MKTNKVMKHIFRLPVLLAAVMSVSCFPTFEINPYRGSVAQWQVVNYTECELQATGSSDYGVRFELAAKPYEVVVLPISIVGEDEFADMSISAFTVSDGQGQSLREWLRDDAGKNAEHHFFDEASWTYREYSDEADFKEWTGAPYIKVREWTYTIRPEDIECEPVKDDGHEN